MEVGHTKFSPDRGFGNIRTALKSRDVYDWNSLCDVINKSSEINEAVLFDCAEYKNWKIICRQLTAAGINPKTGKKKFSKKVWFKPMIGIKKDKMRQMVFTKESEGTDVGVFSRSAFEGGWKNHGILWSGQREFFFS